MDIVDPRQPFTYNSGRVPLTYKCTACKKHGVKLWRNYPPSRSLHCADCAALEQGVDISTMQPSGVYTDQDGSKTDIIRWRVPALLKESNGGFWLYMERNRPDAAIVWWQKIAHTLESSPCT